MNKWKILKKKKKSNISEGKTRVSDNLRQDQQRMAHGPSLAYRLFLCNGGVKNGFYILKKGYKQNKSKYKEEYVMETTTKTLTP